MKAYMGFKKDKGFQYEEGKEYTAAEMSPEENSISSATGKYCVSSATDLESISANTADYSVSITEKASSISSTTGKDGTSIANGICGISATTGISSTSSVTKNFGIAAASGIGSKSVADGINSVAVSTGYNSASVAKHKDSIAISLGLGGIAAGVKGSKIVLADWGDFNSYVLSDVTEIKDIVMVEIDGEKYKPDTWYIMDHGKIIEYDSKRYINWTKDKK